MHSRQSQQRQTGPYLFVSRLINRIVTGEGFNPQQVVAVSFDQKLNRPAAHIAVFHGLMIPLAQINEYGKCFAAVGAFDLLFVNHDSIIPALS